MIRLFLLLGLCLSPLAQAQLYQPPVFTDPGRAEKVKTLAPAIEQIYRDWATANHFPGLAYGVVVDGQLVVSGGMGVTDVARKIPATPQSVFRIASMTKSVTAMAILQLRDAGKLQLDAPLSQYIPQAANLKYLTADAPVITIRHLLTHTGGFPEDNPWGDRQLADSDAELLNHIQTGVSFANVPGYQYEYSNLGFALLGQVITRVSGEPYQQYITKRILQPLGMTQTEWDFGRVPAHQLAHGYRWIDNQWVEEPLLADGSYGAMGGLLTSMDDFSRYVAFQQSAWPPRSTEENQVLKRSSLREMQQPHTFSNLNGAFRFPGGRTTPLVGHYGYGLGWARDGSGIEYVGHSGGLPGFGSQWRMLPDYGIAVVAFGNLTYANLTTPNWAVIELLLDRAGLQPRQLPVSPLLTERKAQLLALLPGWQEAGQSPIFAENFFPDQSISQRRQQSLALFNKIGKIVRVGALVPENQLRGRFIIEGEKGNISVFFTLTPEQPALIQQLTLSELPKNP